MGLFSRSRKNDDARDEPKPAAVTAAAGTDASAPVATPVEAETLAAPEDLPQPALHVDEAAAELAAARARLVNNTIVEVALERWAGEKNAQTMFNVLRQCAAGELLLDGGGSHFANAGQGPSRGDRINIGYQTDNAGKKLLLAFTSNERLAEYHKGERTFSFAVPATSALSQAVKDYDGIVINPGSPATLCIAYSAEISQGLTDTIEINEPLKRALLERRMPWPELLALIAATPVIFVANREVRDEAGTVTGITMPTADAPDGGTYSVAFTSPAEVWAWAPGLNAHPTGISNVARAVAKDGFAGVMINPAGHQVVVSAADLEPLATTPQP